jgi:MFS family permease
MPMGANQAFDADAAASEVQEVRPHAVRSPFNVWRWVNISVAAGAMVATLPGRTFGLGYITKDLMADLSIGEVRYAVINFWGTLLGAAFCLPIGWLQDRTGSRLVLLGTTLCLGASVAAMTQLNQNWGSWLIPSLFLLVLFTRGFGQSALSVVSLALMGRSVRSKAGWDVGVYSFITAAGFMAAAGTIKYALERWEPGWRLLWGSIGLAVAVFGLLAFPLIRSRASKSANGDDGGNNEGMTLFGSLATPAFWVYALATSLYGMMAAGIYLFNQLILEERHFPRSVFLTITYMSPLVGLAANLFTGWLAGRIAHGKLLAGAMLLLTAAMMCFPLVRSLWQVYAYAVAMGIAGGMVTVIFFGIWRRAFGAAHLGKIQGAAQILTVLASALGPVLLATSNNKFGSYVPAFQIGAAASGILAIAAWLVPLPKMQTSAKRG